MNFTLAEAAQKVGISRSSIYRLIDEGKLSASTDRRGKKVVELSELLRVFGSIQEETESDKTQENKKNNTVHVSGTSRRTGQDTLFSTVQELEHLRTQLQLKDMELRLKEKELELANERMQDLRQTTEQVNQEKSKLLNIIERQTLLLAAPKPSKTPIKKAVSQAVKPPLKSPPKKSTATVAAAKSPTPLKKVASKGSATKPQPAKHKKRNP